MGAVPGFASLATTSGTPAARSAATGGGACPSVKHAAGKSPALTRAAARAAIPLGADVLEVIRRQGPQLGAQLGPADVRELPDVHPHAEPSALRRDAYAARFLDGESVRVHVSVHKPREPAERHLRHEDPRGVLDVTLRDSPRWGARGARGTSGPQTGVRRRPLSKRAIARSCFRSSSGASP